jgi:hypothetical protein
MFTSMLHDNNFHAHHFFKIPPQFIGLSNNPDIVNQIQLAFVCSGIGLDIGIDLFHDFPRPLNTFYKLHF